MCVSTQEADACHRRRCRESAITFRHEQHDTRSFQKEEAAMTHMIDECASVGEGALLLEHCVFVCLFPELTNCRKVNSGAPAPIVMLSPTHTRTPFP